MGSHPDPFADPWFWDKHKRASSKGVYSYRTVTMLAQAGAKAS
uniref:Uncharacterized protein n=1 Tax=Anguilla anguilla TaxID=7936 RepID=A0A0E9SZA9_ANGAN